MSDTIDRVSESAGATSVATPSSEKESPLSPSISQKALSSDKQTSLKHSPVHSRQPSHDLDLTPLRIQLTSQQTTINTLNAEKGTLEARISELETRLNSAGQGKDEEKKLQEQLKTELVKAQKEGERVKGLVRSSRTLVAMTVPSC
jgi:peptidoglycan hydrolase CwlO-like protein